MAIGPWRQRYVVPDVPERKHPEKDSKASSSLVLSKDSDRKQHQRLAASRNTSTGQQAERQIVEVPDLLPLEIRG